MSKLHACINFIKNYVSMFLSVKEVFLHVSNAHIIDLYSQTYQKCYIEALSLKCVKIVIRYGAIFLDKDIKLP